MRTKNLLTCSAKKKRVPGTRAVWMLVWGILTFAWPYIPDYAIGKEASDTTGVPTLMLVADQQTQSLEDLIAALNKGNPYERQRAAIALGNAKDAQAVEPLNKSIKDDDDFVRNFSARALGNIGDSKALNPLIQALSDKHTLVRYSAARALGSLKDSRAVDPLINALESGDYLAQRSAAEALSEIGDPKAIDPLIKALGNDDIFIQTGASNALIKIGKPAIPRLVAALEEARIGLRAAEVLKELQWRPASEQEKKSFEIALKSGPSAIKN
jgi:HEAT repeat protein